MRAAAIPAFVLIFGATRPCHGGDDPSDTGDTGTTSELQYWLECGDPVCSGYGGPFDGVPLCDDDGISVGDPCSADGTTCDPVDGCNALVVCAEEDPTMQPGGCPISLKRHKHDIHYLDVEQRQAAADALLAMPLATWHYNWEANESPNHLGFLIDDVVGSPAVRPDGEHVDLYGYTSLAVAAIQAQQAQIDALRAEVEALKSLCAP